MPGVGVVVALKPLHMDGRPSCATPLGPVQSDSSFKSCQVVVPVHTCTALAMPETRIESIGITVLLY